jgi:hypothetical protein
MSVALLLLGLTYGAAIVLVVRDHLIPQQEHAPRPLKRRPPLWFFPIWALVVAFGLTVWLIIYGPAALWKSLRNNSLSAP